MSQERSVAERVVEPNGEFTKKCTECGKSFDTRYLPRRRGVLRCPHCLVIVCPNCFGGLRNGDLHKKTVECPHCKAGLGIKRRAAGKKPANGDPVNGIDLLRVPFEGKLKV